MSGTIRPARAEDRAAIEQIVAAAYARYVPRIGRKPAPMDADYAALIARARVHVLDEDGVVHGLVVLVAEADRMLLENIAVAPDREGQGLGRRLLEFAERAARDAGFGAIRLYTNAAMVENIALYGRIGYVEAGRHGEGGFHRVDMVKALR